MGTHRVSVHVAAPPERVFGLWTDLDRQGELNTFARMAEAAEASGSVSL